MKFKNTDIHGYFINPEKFSHRLNDITNTLKSLNLSSFTRITFDDISTIRTETIANAHIAAVENAISDNNFPFIIFEDDATLINDFPEFFDIPDESDLIYLGGSLYNCGGIKYDMYIENYNENYYRVYNMLSSHSILITNLKNAKLYITIMKKSIEKSEFSDIYLALSSNENIFLTPKDGPYFFQNDYTSDVTKFLWIDKIIEVLK